jgi:hypothetical protein
MKLPLFAGMAVAMSVLACQAATMVTQEEARMIAIAEVAKRTGVTFEPTFVALYDQPENRCLSSDRMFTEGIKRHMIDVQTKLAGHIYYLVMYAAADKDVIFGFDICIFVGSANGAILSINQF